MKQDTERRKSIGLRWWLKLGAENLVPEAVGNAEAVLVVEEVVLEVVLLEALVPQRQVVVVEEVVGQVVADVTEKTTTEDGSRCVNAVEEDYVG